MHAATSRAMENWLLSPMGTASLTASLASLPAAAVASNIMAQLALSVTKTAQLTSSLASLLAAAIPRTVFQDAQKRHVVLSKLLLIPDQQSSIAFSGFLILCASTLERGNTRSQLVYIPAMFCFPRVYPMLDQG